MDRGAKPIDKPAINGLLVGAKVGANVHRLQATSGDVRRLLYQVMAAFGRRGTTSGGCAELIWEQEAAGSNPAIPTKSAGHRVVVRDQGAFQDRLTVI